MELTTVSSGSRKGNCHILDDGKTKVLLDAGVAIRNLKESTSFTLSSISGALITHEHKDHSRCAAAISSAGVDVYMSKGTAGKSGVSGHRLHNIKSMDSFSIGTFNCMAFDVEHDAIEPLGFVLTSTETGERAVYVTDTKFVKYRIPGVTHWIVECDFDEGTLSRNVSEGIIAKALANRIRATHMSLQGLKKMLKANDLSSTKRIYLTHLSETNSCAERMKAEIERCAAGVDVTIAGR